MELPLDILCEVLIPIAYVEEPEVLSVLLCVCKAATETETAKIWRNFLRVPDKCREAAVLNNTNLFKLCFRRYTLSEDVYAIAARNGNLEILEYIGYLKEYSKYSVKDPRVNPRNSLPRAICIETAAKAGQITVLEWFGVPFLTKFPASGRTIEAAVANNQLAVLKWWLQHKLPVPKELGYLAASRGHFELMFWCYENVKANTRWNERFLECAVKNQRLNVLYWCLTQLKCRIGENLINSVAWHGNLEMIRLCVENSPLRPSLATKNCIGRGGLEVLRWLLDQGFEIHEECLAVAMSRGQFECIKYLYKYHRRKCHLDASLLNWVLISSSLRNKLEILKWCIKKGFAYDTSTFRHAVLNEDCSELVEYLRSLDPPCPWDASVSLQVLDVGNVEVFCWCLLEGCPMHEDVPRIAAKRGDVALLRFLVSRGVPMDEKILNKAASRGQLEVIQYLRSLSHIPCKWSEKTIECAREAGQSEVVAWCVANGCPGYEAYSDYNEESESSEDSFSRGS